jgi:hypothetical protein
LVEAVYDILGLDLGRRPVMMAMADNNRVHHQVPRPGVGFSASPVAARVPQAATPLLHRQEG